MNLIDECGRLGNERDAYKAQRDKLLAAAKSALDCWRIGRGEGEAMDILAAAIAKAEEHAE